MLWNIFRALSRWFFCSLEILKNFQVCAGLMKKFVVCVCDERYSKNKVFNYRRKDEENCNLC